MSYLLDLYKPLTREQEIKAWEDGDTDTLACSQIAYVVRIARKYATKTGVDLDDLVAAGFLGLSKALQTYDATKTRLVSYSTVAIVWAVRNEIKINARSNYIGPKSRPESGVSMHTSSPGIPQEGLGMSAFDRNAVSDAEDKAREGELKSQFWEAVGALPERDAAVIRMMADGDTLRTIGERLALTRQRVMIIRDQAMEQIRQEITRRIGISITKQPQKLHALPQH